MLCLFVHHAFETLTIPSGAMYSWHWQLFFSVYPLILLSKRRSKTPKTLFAVSDQVKYLILYISNIRAHLFLLEAGSCYIFSNWNNCFEFLASDGANLQCVHQSACLLFWNCKISIILCIRIMHYNVWLMISLQNNSIRYNKIFFFFNNCCGSENCNMTLRQMKQSRAKIW